MSKEQRADNLVEKIVDIYHNDNYPCENPFERHQNGLIIRAIRSYIKKELYRIKDENHNYQMIGEIKGHGCYSCFIQDLKKPNLKLVYVSVNFPTYYNYNHLINDLSRVLYRTTDSAKSTTGGFNHFSKLPDLIENVVKLLREGEIK